MAETGSESDNPDARVEEWFSAADERQVAEAVLGNRRHGL
jgi:hypothetical protein